MPSTTIVLAVEMIVPLRPPPENSRGPRPVAKEPGGSHWTPTVRGVSP